MDQLKQAYWLSENRKTIIKVLYIVAIVVCSLIWLNVGRYLIQYITTYGAAERAYQTIGDVSVKYDSRERPRPLSVVTKNLLTDSSSTVDAYAVVHNPNHFFGAHFDYTLHVGAESYDFTDATVMPQEDAYVALPSIEGVKSTDSFSIVITNTAWLPAPGQLPRIDFAVSNEKLGPIIIQTGGAATNTANTNNANILTPTDKQNENTSTVPVTEQTLTGFTADVLNDSAYGFRQATAVVVLQDPEGTVFGVKPVLWHDVASNGTTHIQITWQRRFPINVTAQVFVFTDYISTDNLIYPGE